MQKCKFSRFLALSFATYGAKFEFIFVTLVVICLNVILFFQIQTLCHILVNDDFAALSMGESSCCRRGSFAESFVGPLWKYVGGGDHASLLLSAAHPEQYSMNIAMQCREAITVARTILTQHGSSLGRGWTNALAI